VPAAIAAARAVLAARAAVLATAPLGPDPLLTEAMESRLRELGVWPGDPDVAVLLASAGSSDPGVRAGIGAMAARWARSGWHSVTPAYATAARPDVAGALASAHAAGPAETVVASYFLAPGHLADRVALGAAGLPMSAPFLTPEDADPALVRLVVRRAAQALEREAAQPRRHGQARTARAHAYQDPSTRARSAARS
jgi:sirohydrochlorin ferrochelatase